MRTGLSPKEFFNAMKKKPELQSILNAFEAYTVEELENIHGQPLWIRKVLVELKQDEIGGIVDEGAALRAEQIADMMMNASELQPTEEPAQYEVRHYQGNDWQMNCGMHGSMQVEVKYDDLLYIMDVDPLIEKYIVGMDSVVGILTEIQWNRMMQSSISLGNMTKEEYTKEVSKMNKDKMTKTPEERDFIAREAGPRSYVDPKDTKKFEIISHGITYT